MMIGRVRGVFEGWIVGVYVWGWCVGVRWFHVRLLRLLRGGIVSFVFVELFRGIVVAECYWFIGFWFFYCWYDVLVGPVL